MIYFIISKKVFIIKELIKIKKVLLLILITIITITLCVGCSKDDILNTYDKFNRAIGDLNLTKDYKLKGHRTFGKDHYVGEYQVKYENFKGKEILFGGTTIERETGESIHLKIEVSDSFGNINIYMRLKDKQEPLIFEDGTYEFDFNVKDGSNYLIIEAENYSGNININIE